MPRLRLLLILLAASACSPPAPPPPDAPITAAPAAVLFQLDVWQGNGAPHLIVYADGTVLSPRERTADGWPLSYEVSRVHASTAREALAYFGIGDAFMRLDSAYDFEPGWSDQPTVVIMTWDGKRRRQVAVRSGWFEIDRLKRRVPAPFRTAFGRMNGYRPARSRPWQPDTIEAIVLDYSYAPNDPSLPWPPGWPDLRSPAARRDVSRDMESYTIALPGRYHADLTALLLRLRDRQAVEINGGKWSVHDRLRLPGETAWQSWPFALEP